MKEDLNLIKRGIDELIGEDELISKLKSKKKFWIPMLPILLKIIIGQANEYGWQDF